MTVETASRSRKISWKSWPFIAFHFTPLLLIPAGFSWEGVALCVASYAIRMFGVTGGYHRYFSHRSFKTSRAGQFLLAFLAQSSLQKGVLWWASHHRFHHWHSDKPEDVHSPLQSGFFHSHVGWILTEDWDKWDTTRVRDLAKYPELVWIDRHHWVPALVYAVALQLAFGFHGLVWGFFVSTVLLWHGTFTINSLSHVFGKRVYDTSDTSRNNWLLAIITLGEGWHNNHHFYQRSTAQGFRWYEFDATYLVLKVMSWFRLVWDVTRPPREVIERTIAHARSRTDQLGVEVREMKDRATAALQESRDQLGAEVREMKERASVALQESREQLGEMKERASVALQESREQLGEMKERASVALQEKVEAVNETARRLSPEPEPDPVP